jgi:dTDP-glucose 4,6-dehydratase
MLESLLFAHDKLDLHVNVVVLTRDPERFREKAPHLAGHSALRLLCGNIVGFEFPEGHYPFVIHAATEASFAADSRRPLGTFSTDVDGTRRVLEFARTHGVRRLLFASSGAVYGKQPSDMTHIPEEYMGAPSTTDVASAYGQAKRSSEFMCMMYGRAYAFDAIIARLFAFVGPLLPLDAHYAVGNFIRDALRGGPVRIAGDGTPYRSYLYAADLAIWLWTLLFRGQAAYPYNVGSHSEMTIEDLARTVVQVAAPGASIEIARRANPETPPLRYVPRIDRAQNELGLSITVQTEEGIRRTAEWHRMRMDLGG